MSENQTNWTKRQKIGLIFIIPGTLIAGICYLGGTLGSNEILLFFSLLGLIACGIGIYLEVSTPSTHDKKMYIISAVAILLAIIISFSGVGSCSSSNPSKNYTCSVCARTFNSGTSNSKSIIKTGMCSQCYKNYKWAIGE
ncbi:MAG: hypothetical protein IKA72_03210 [Clostridia bacterium]|nr:hypothetical protein [Clostridia bacterium]